MIALDPRSMIAMGTVMAALMSVVLFFMRRHYPRSIRGVGYWAAAPAIWLVASVLFGARGRLPDAVTLVLANVLLMLGSIVYYAGCRLFFGQTVQWRGWSALLAVSLLTFWVLTDLHPRYGWRLAIFTAVMIAVYAVNLRFMWRRGSKRLPVRMVQIILAVHIAVLIFRFLTVAMGMAGDGLLESTPIQTLYIGAYVLTVLMLSIAAVLMATDRLVVELEHLATHDPLTRTLNRRALLQRFEDELARCQRTGKGPSLMMVDLDHFKAINDTYGHQHGDAVLVHFAQCAQAALRRADRLGRYGGEEFIVLLPETSAQDALVVADRIHAALAVGHALDCKLSIGLTGWIGPADTLDAMLARADGALYDAKAQGRDQSRMA